MKLMRVVLRVNGDTFSTVDTPENIGPWIGRMFSVLVRDPGCYFNVESVMQVL